MPASLRQRGRRGLAGSSRRAAEDSRAESLGCDAVLQNLARLLNPRRRPGARPVHAAFRGCSGALRKRLDLSGGRLHLSRHPARPAPRAAGRHCGPVVSFRAGHGNLHVCASARLLPLAGHLNHGGQWQKA